MICRNINQVEITASALKEPRVWKKKKTHLCHDLKQIPSPLCVEAFSRK